MKKLIALFCISSLGLSLLARADQTSFTQPNAGSDAQEDADLLGASATLAGGILTVTGTAGDVPTDWTHVFLGTESSAVGYVHTNGKQGGVGMNYMIEGDKVYQWGGTTDRQEWNWKPLDTKVTRSKADKSFTVSIPVARLHLHPGTKLRIFLVTSTKDFQAAQDALPRDNSVWTLDVTADGLKSAGNTSLNDGPVSSPAADARVRFKKVASYACYYGKDAVDQLSQRDAVIIETKSQSPGNITAIKKKGALSS